jgi:hypothetical protein
MEKINMKNIKETTLKSLLVIALLATPIFADGDMGGGGFANYETGTKAGSTSQCEGDMGGGGFRSGDEEATFLDALIREVSEFFGVIG